MNKPTAQPSDPQVMTALANHSPLAGFALASRVDERTEDEFAGLLAKAKAGDRLAFAALVEQTYDRAYTIAIHTLRSPEDARDIVQEAFVRVQKGLPDFQGQAKFTTWLYRVVVNLCLDSLRRKKVAPVVSDPQTLESADERRSPEQNAGDGELGLLLEQGLAELSETHRVALVLYEVEGLSYDEIAKVTNARMGTVMSRLFHARKRMQQFLSKHLGDAAPNAERLVDDRTGDSEVGEV